MLIDNRVSKLLATCLPLVCILLFVCTIGIAYGGGHGGLGDFHSAPGDGLVTPVVSTVLLLMLLAAGVLATSGSIGIPFAVAMVLTGFCLVQLAPYFPSLVKSFATYEFSPEIFLYVFLPTLIFETAFNMDTRELRDNLLSISAMAIPGILISTAIIGTLVFLLTSVEPPAAFLLGAILSIIDHVAVGSLLKQIGAPKRLMILMEGESLFSEVTIIAAAHILFETTCSGNVTSGSFISGIEHFFIAFTGGISVGVLIALVTGLILGKVRDKPLIELSLIIVLAYMPFLIAEHYAHVSGVMATAAAGITMGGWGRVKISPSVRNLLEEMWAYMAFIANSFIFMLIGLQMNISLLVKYCHILMYVIPSMLLARGAVVYGLMPIVGFLTNSNRIDCRYRTLMYWGSMRGGIAMAMFLSLGAFKYTETFMAVITGVVFFSLVIQGLSIRPLVRKLGLDIPTLADRVARLEGVFSAKKHALDCIPALQRGGLFSAGVARDLHSKCEASMEETRSELLILRSEELDKHLDIQQTFFRCFAEEKAKYYEMFGQEHLSESAFRNLSYSVDMQMEALRYQRDLPESSLHQQGERRKEWILHLILTRMLPLGFLYENLHTVRTAREYEQVWGRHQASMCVLKSLDEMMRHTPARAEVLNVVNDTYKKWNIASRERLDSIAEQFPEFVSSMQQRLAERMLVHAEREAIEEQERNGTISHSVAKVIMEKLTDEAHRLRRRETEKLMVAPSELLNKVRFFRNIPQDDFLRIVEYLRPHTIPAGKVIIRQGETGDSLYLIARGVVRISRVDMDKEKDLATMIAGDFFGEIALLEHCPRTATCRAVTPCVLYELTKRDFDTVVATCPSIYDAVYKTGHERAAVLKGDNNEEIV